MRLRLLCSAAPWAIFSNFSAFFASFLPSHLTTDQSAGKAQRADMPNSVAFWATNSSLSPFGKPMAMVTEMGNSTLSVSSSMISTDWLWLSTTRAKRLIPSSNTKTIWSPACKRMTENMCLAVSLSLIWNMPCGALPLTKYCCILASNHT